MSSNTGQEYVKNKATAANQVPVAAADKSITWTDAATAGAPTGSQYLLTDDANQLNLIHSANSNLEITHDTTDNTLAIRNSTGTNANTAITVKAPLGGIQLQTEDGRLSLEVYSAGAQSEPWTFADIGGTNSVTQITSITTAVTINAYNGTILTVSSTLAAGASAAFTVNNNRIGVISTSRFIMACVVDYDGAGSPVVHVGNYVNNTSFQLTLTNAHGTNALNNTVLIYFWLMNIF